MNRVLAHPATQWTCRIVIAGLFLTAAYGKIIEPHEFATTVRNFEIGPRALTHLPAIIMPWLETLAALAILSGVWRRAGVWWITLMLAFFTLSFFWVLSQGISVDCGCFGKSGDVAAGEFWLKTVASKVGGILGGDVGLKSIIRNTILLGMCYVMLRHDRA